MAATASSGLVHAALSHGPQLPCRGTVPAEGGRQAVPSDAGDGSKEATFWGNARRLPPPLEIFGNSNAVGPAGRPSRERRIRSGRPSGHLRHRFPKFSSDFCVSLPAPEVWTSTSLCDVTEHVYDVRRSLFAFSPLRVCCHLHAK